MNLVRLCDNLSLEGEAVLGDVGGGDVMVAPGRDGGSGRCHPDGDHGLGQEVGLELTSNGEVETAGGGDPAGGLDRVSAETLRLFGLEAQLIARDGGPGCLVPTQSLVNAGIFAILLLEIEFE